MRIGWGVDAEVVDVLVVWGSLGGPDWGCAAAFFLGGMLAVRGRLSRVEGVGVLVVVW